MNYILEVKSKKAFVVMHSNNDITITADSTRANRYPTIGDAMMAAIKVNNALGTHSVKVKSV